MGNKIIPFFLALLILFGYFIFMKLIGGFNIIGNSSPSPDGTYKTVSIKQLYDDIDNNILSAKDKYLGQYVTITGEIGSIQTSYIVIYEINETYNFKRVFCRIKNDEQINIIKTMNEGDIVTVKGKLTDIGEIIGCYLNIVELYKYNNIKTDNTSFIKENSYQQIYDEYSEKINSVASTSSTNEITAILKEGTYKMTNYMLSSDGIDGQLSTMDKWSKKLSKVADDAISLNQINNYSNYKNGNYNNSNSKNRDENIRQYYINERISSRESYSKTANMYILTVNYYQTEDYNSTVGAVVDGDEWVVVNMEFKNNSNKTVIINKNDFRLIDGAKRYSYGPYHKHLSTEIDTIEIRANQSATFSVRFVYHKDREMSLRYYNIDFSPYEYIDINLR